MLVVRVGCARSDPVPAACRRLAGARPAAAQGARRGGGGGGPGSAPTSDRQMEEEFRQVGAGRRPDDARALGRCFVRLEHAIDVCGVLGRRGHPGADRLDDRHRLTAGRPDADAGALTRFGAVPVPRCRRRRSRRAPTPRRTVEAGRQVRVREDGHGPCEPGQAGSMSSSRRSKRPSVNAAGCRRREGPRHLPATPPATPSGAPSANGSCSTEPCAAQERGRGWPALATSSSAAGRDHVDEGDQLVGAEPREHQVQAGRGPRPARGPRRRRPARGPHLRHGRRGGHSAAHHVADEGDERRRRGGTRRRSRRRPPCARRA